MTRELVVGYSWGPDRGLSDGVAGPVDGGFFGGPSWYVFLGQYSLEAPDDAYSYQYQYSGAEVSPVKECDVIETVEWFLDGAPYGTSTGCPWDMSHVDGGAPGAPLVLFNGAGAGETHTIQAIVTVKDAVGPIIATDEATFTYHGCAGC
mmetsp:Transcript_14691/g.58734  ORF Transcript_14691/g.58734 Transcript_14691/m.58734 type:complete len:149 (+) Transcript_14691:1111-1557(+)